MHVNPSNDPLGFAICCVYRQWWVEGEALASAPLFQRPSSRCFAPKISSFLVKNLLSPLIYSKADHTVSKYSAFKRTPNSHCYVCVLCFQLGSQ